MKHVISFEGFFFLSLGTIGLWLLLLGAKTPLVPAEFEAYQITATELAQKMIENPRHFSIIDLTGKNENLYFKNILTADRKSPIIPQVLDFVAKNRDQTMVLVGAETDESNDELRLYAYQLAQKKYKAVILTGGVESWKRDILQALPNSKTPTPAEETAAETEKRFNHQQMLYALSQYIQGKSIHGETNGMTAPPRKLKVRLVPRHSGGGGGC